MSSMSNIFDIFTPSPAVPEKVETGIFGFFKGKPSPPPKTYSLFTGSPNQIQTPSNADIGQHPADVQNSITASFTRQPLWYGGSVVPNVSPTVESSLYNPLAMQVQNMAIDVSAPPVTMIIGPPQGKHWMVIAMTLQLPGANIPPTEQVFFYIGLNPNPATPLAQQCCILKINSPITNPSVALIGSNILSLPALLTTNTMLDQGVSPKYLGNGLKLVLNIFNTGGGIPARLGFLFYELPENQPFGNLISTL